MRYIIAALLIATTSLATANERYHRVITEGGVQRIAVMPFSPHQASHAATTRQLIIQATPRQTTHYQPAPRANAPTTTHQAVLRLPQRQQTPNRVSRIPANIANNAINTAIRTTEQQLNWKISNTIRRSIRKTIQF